MQANSLSKSVHDFLSLFFERTNIHGFFYFALPFLRAIEKFDKIGTHFSSNMIECTYFQTVLAVAHRNRFQRDHNFRLRVSGPLQYQEHGGDNRTRPLLLEHESAQSDHMSDIAANRSGAVQRVLCSKQHRRQAESGIYGIYRVYGKCDIRHIWTHQKP